MVQSAHSWKQLGIQKTVSAQSKETTFQRLRKLFPFIYVDETMLQRFLNEWSEQVMSDHMVACFRGHSNIYSFVLINVESVLQDCQERLAELEEQLEHNQDEIKSSTQHQNISESIEYFSDILKNKKKKYLLIDGQHRIDTYKKYLNDEFVILEDIWYNITSSNGEPVPVNLKNKKFSTLPTQVQSGLLEETKFLITEIQKGQFRELVNVTIYTNIGEPWNNHERRIIVPSPFVRQILKWLTKDALWNSMFYNPKGPKVKDMKGHYSLSKKGISLMLCEYVGYYFNTTKGQHHQWPDDSQLDKMCSLEGLDGLTKTGIKNALLICSKVGEVIGSSSSTYTRSQVDNLFILLTTLMNAKNTKNPYSKKLKIENVSDFQDWFFKMELKLRETNKYIIDPTTNKPMVDPTGKLQRNGKPKLVENPDSFLKKCSNHKSADIEIRLDALLDEFNSGYNKLFSNGVASFVNTKQVTKSQRKEVAVKSDFTTFEGDEVSYDEVFGQGTSIDVDHIEATDLGGEHETDNMSLRTATKNRSKQNKKEII